MATSFKGLDERMCLLMMMMMMVTMIKMSDNQTKVCIICNSCRPIYNL